VAAFRRLPSLDLGHCSRRLRRGGRRINSRNQAIPLVIVQRPKLILFGPHGPHVLEVLHVSKDDPELLGQLLKAEEQEEGALLVLRYLVQEVGWLPLPPKACI
jgi:hypothetical protein